MSILQDLLAWIATVPPLAWPVLVFVCGYTEHVFPPAPADTAMLLAFFLAAREGDQLLATMVVAAIVGSVLGAWTAFRLGRRYGDRILSRLARRPRLARWLERVEDLLQRRGEPVMALNRFLPGARNVMHYVAGAVGLRAGASIAWSTLSNILFVALLAAIGRTSGGSLEVLFMGYRDAVRGLGIVAGLAAIVWLALGIRRRLSRARRDPA
ncbi:MAG: VTT domain-containing protein [Acidobacteriota bacterium]